MTQSIEVEMIPSSFSNQSADVEYLMSMVNQAFASSENGIWQEGATRTTSEEMIEIIHRGKMAVAKSMDQTIGCISVRKIDGETGEFSMLAVDNTHQGSGVGRTLIQFAKKM